MAYWASACCTWAAAGHDGSTHGESEFVVRAPSVNTFYKLNMKEVARNIDMQQISVKNRFISKDEDKLIELQKLRTAQLNQMLRIFIVRQLLVYTADNNFGEISVTLAVRSTSKYLKDTRRAFNLRMGATALLATVDLVRSWSCVLTSKSQSGEVSSGQSF